MIVGTLILGDPYSTWWFPGIWESKNHMPVASEPREVADDTVR